MVKKLKINEGPSNSKSVDPLQFLTYKMVGPTVTIVGCDKSVTKIDIPTRIEGYPVTKISSFAFMNCKRLRVVIIPDTVTTLGSNAFSGCTRLRSVTLSKSLTKLDKYLFYNYSKLASITIPKSVITIGEDVLYGCTGLEEVRATEMILSKLRYDLNSEVNLYQI